MSEHGTVALLASRPPDPRLLRRMSSLAGSYHVVLVYWDRLTGMIARHDTPPGIQECALAIKAPVSHWLRRLPILIRFACRAVALLARIRPGALHCDQYDMLMVGWIYRAVCDRGVKLVYEVPDLPAALYDERLAARLLRGFLRWLERLACKSLSLLVVTSPHFYDVHYCRFIPANKVITQLNTPMRTMFGSFIPGDHDCLMIGAFGTIRYPDQLKHLIDSVRNNRKIRIIIAGDGKNYDQIRLYVTDIDNVEFLGPYDYARDILSLYARVDCLHAVYDTSRYNVRLALPNRLYEAIACGLPIIVAKGTALEQFVKSEGIGFSVSDRSPDDLRRLLGMMQEDASILLHAREKMRRIRDEYFFENQQDAFRKKYAGILG